MKSLDTANPQPTGKVKWVLFNSKTYKTIIYLLLSLPLGIIYFTLALTGITLSIGLIPLFIGIPMFFGVAKGLNMLVKFEQTMIRQILGLPAPPEPYMYHEQTETGQNWFMRMVRSFDGSLFVRDLMLVMLKFVTGIVFFVIMITVLSIGLGLISLPVVHIILMKEINIDILEHGLFNYFNIDWTYNQQYMVYVGAGLVIFWIGLRIVNGLMAVQRKIMYVDEPYQPVQQQQQLHQPYYDEELAMGEPIPPAFYGQEEKASLS